MVEMFASTLVGAFTGVTGSFALERYIQWRSFKKYIDALFVQCEAYTSSVKARHSGIQDDLESIRNKGETYSLVKLIRDNIDPPDSVGGYLVAEYGKYLRVQDIQSVIQAESNMRVMYRDLVGTGVTEDRMNSRFESLILESARRSWSIYCVFWKCNLSFSQERYKSIVEEMNKSINKRITKIKPSTISA